MTILPVCQNNSKMEFEQKNYTTSNLTAGVLDLFLGISEVKIGFVGFVGLGISQHQQF